MKIVCSSEMIGWRMDGYPNNERLSYNVSTYPSQLSSYLSDVIKLSKIVDSLILLTYSLVYETVLILWMIFVDDTAAAD